MVSDIAKMPHLLIASATGSGKSVCINTLIMSILYKARPDEVKLIMIDQKVVELSAYNGIPHLLIPVVTDPKKAAGALNWAVAEMMGRYNQFAELNVRNIEGYNEKIDSIKDIPDDNKREKMPQIVIIVDELADLMMVAPGEVEGCHLSSGTACKSSRYSPDHCDSAAIGQCHHRSYQGKYAVTNCICRILRCGFPYHSGYERSGEASGKRGYAVFALRYSEAVACAGSICIGCGSRSSR